MKKNYIVLKTLKFASILFSLLLFSGYHGIAQNLNFTIDTAIDNGNNISETIISGSFTFVLTVDHVQDVEELDNLGGGDLIFYLGSGSASTPFVLTITRNGEPIQFKLNSIDYDTLGAGTISLTNGDGEFISVPTAYPLGNGTLFISNPTNAFGISEIRINPGGITDLNNFGFHNINVDYITLLGVYENSVLENNVSIFPNPSNGDITIQNSSIVLEKAVITDLNGRIIVTYNLNGIIGNQDLKMSSVLSAGMYLMTISSENATATKKLIIE
jgi:hypothetical protein